MLGVVVNELEFNSFQYNGLRFMTLTDDLFFQ